MRTLLLALALSATLAAQTAVYPGAVVTDQQLKIAVNNTTTTLNASMLSTDNVIVVQNSTGFVPNMLVTVDTEIIAVCAVAGNLLTVGHSSCPNTDGRGFDGTTAASHVAGVTVNGFVDAWHSNAKNKEIEAIETALGANLSLVKAWNSLAAPTGNLSLALGNNTSLFTAGNATGSNMDVWKVTDTAGNTGTGNLLHLTTTSGSALHPVQIDNNGNGLQMSTLGVLFPVGTGGIDASSLTSGSIPGARIANSTVTNAMLAGSIAASKLIGTDITTLGTIGTGTWQGTAVGVLYGGTGASTAATARANLSAAASGPNSDITSLTGLATPLSVAQGGTGVTLAQGNGTKVQLASGAAVSGDCVKYDANGNAVDAGAPCGTGSGGPSTLIVTSTYNFSPQTPGGTLTSGVTNTVTLTPCPLGVNGSDLGHYYYVSGGIGGPEAVFGTGGTCTSGAASGTLTFVPVNNHSGAWTIGPANAGLQEAFNVAGLTPVYVPPGTWQIYAPARPPSGQTLTCAGKFTTFLQATGAAIGIIDATGTKNRIEHCGFTATTQQTSGGYGIRLGNCGASCDNAFTVINDNYFEPLYDAVLSVNASQTWFTNNVCYNFSHTCFTAADANFPDSDGPWVANNVMFNYNLSSPALACLYITSSGGITFHHNNCFGSGTTNLNYNVYLNSVVSTQLIIDDNVLETAQVSNIFLNGAFNLIAITGNTIAQPLCSGCGAQGIQIVGSASSGPSMYQGTITGNVFQGPGQSNAWKAIAMAEAAGGTNIAWYFGGNSFNQVNTPYLFQDAAEHVTIGTNRYDNTNFTISGTPTNVIMSDMGFQPTFSALPSLANGSQLFVSDGNSTCTAGSSTGRTCFRENGAWTH
ncbi:MAG TPA: hypothetical protein VKX49_12615 [Bryobacteraceae bacterium]|nr:hypothetical protein [Bryobacteraceae bacterium]